MNTKAIVLKEIPLKEEDKIIVVFSKEYGKLSMYAKESRKTKSPFLAGTQLLTYSDFYIHKKDNLSNIKRIEIIDSFIDIKNDIEKLYYAMYFAEFVDRLIIEENPAKEMFNFYVHTMQKLKTRKNLKLMKCIFEFRMLMLAGIMPNVVSCQYCGNDISDDVYFVPQEDGIVCTLCNVKKRGIKISKTTLYTLKYIAYADVDSLYKFQIDKIYLDELFDVISSYKKCVFDKTFKTEKFLENL